MIISGCDSVRRNPPPSRPPPAGWRSQGSLPRRGRGRNVSAREIEPVKQQRTTQKLYIPTPVPLPLLKAARALRGSMTDAEQLLWCCLRHKQLGGFRFRRQHPIERFVLDFYCCKTKLAIELDGGQHNEPGTKVLDLERTEFLESHGIQVVRFWNNEVFINLEGVLQKVFDVSMERANLLPLPSPPPPGEGTKKLLHPAGGGREGGSANCKILHDAK